MHRGCRDAPARIPVAVRTSDGAVPILPRRTRSRIPRITTSSPKALPNPRNKPVRSPRPSITTVTRLDAGYEHESYIYCNIDNVYKKITVKSAKIIYTIEF